MADGKVDNDKIVPDEASSQSQRPGKETCPTPPPSTPITTPTPSTETGPQATPNLPNTPVTPPLFLAPFLPPFPPSSWLPFPYLPRNGPPQNPTLPFTGLPTRRSIFPVSTMPASEWWSPPPLPSFPAESRLSQTPSSPSPTPTYVTLEQKGYIKDIERLRNVLSGLELEVERRCEEIVTLYMANLGTHIFVITGGSIMGNFFFKNPGTVYCFLGLIVLTLFMGVGMASFFNWMKLNNFRWRMTQIEGWRAQLKRAVVSFNDTIQRYAGVFDSSSNLTLNDARDHSKVLLSSFDFGRLRQDHRRYFIVCFVWAVVYISAVILWNIFMQPASKHYMLGDPVPGGYSHTAT